MDAAEQSKANFFTVESPMLRLKPEISGTEGCYRWNKSVERLREGARSIGLNRCDHVTD
jgi:hypothetical protein